LQTIFWKWAEVIDSIITKYEEEVFKSWDEWKGIIKDVYTPENFMDLTWEKFSKMIVRSGETIIDIWKKKNQDGKRIFTSLHPWKSIYNRAWFASEIYGDMYECINDVIVREDNRLNVPIDWHNWKKSFLSEEITPDILMKLTNVKLRKTYVSWYSLWEIAWFLGVRKTNNLDNKVEVYGSKYFLALLWQLIFWMWYDCFDFVVSRERDLWRFPKNISEIKNLIIKEWYNPDTIMGLSFWDFKTAQVAGILFSDITRVVDKKGNHVLSCERPTKNLYSRALFCKIIFWEWHKSVDQKIEDEEEKLLAPTTKEGWEREFVKKWYTPDMLFSYSIIQIEEIRICGFSLGELWSQFEIKKVYGISGNSNPSKNKYNLACLLLLIFWGWYQKIDRIFYSIDDWKNEFEKIWYSKEHIYWLSEDNIKGIKICWLSFWDIALLLQVKKYFGYKEKSNFYNKKKHLPYLLDFIWLRQGELN